MPNNETNNEAAINQERDWRDVRRAQREKRRETWRSSPWRGLFWGLSLVLLGAIFLLNQAGWISGDTWWQVLLIGLGVIFIGKSLVWRRALGWGNFGAFITGIVLILVGILFMVGFSQWWPLILIVAGIAFLFRFFWR
jgi:hypothetical protein